MVAKSNARYRPRSGGHNKSCSIAQIREFKVPSKCKTMASKMNQKLKIQDMKRGKITGFVNQTLKKQIGENRTD